MAELQYNNEAESPATLAKSSEAIRKALGKDLADKLPGSAEPPSAVGLLPKDERIPNGVAFAPKDALGVPGAGAGAQGYYRAGASRWRVFSAARDDAEQAKDVLRAFRKRPGASAVPGLGDEAVAFTVGGAGGVPKTDWVAARKGTRVLGVGDEEHALEGGAGKVKREDAVAKVRALVDAAPAATPRSPDAAPAGAPPRRRVSPRGGGAPARRPRCRARSTPAPPRAAGGLRRAVDEPGGHGVVVAARPRQLGVVGAEVVDHGAREPIADPLPHERREPDEQVARVGVAHEGHRAEPEHAVGAPRAVLFEHRAQVPAEHGELRVVRREAPDLAADGVDVRARVAPEGDEQALHLGEVDVEAGAPRARGVVEPARARRTLRTRRISSPRAASMSGPARTRRRARRRRRPRRAARRDRGSRATRGRRAGRAELVERVERDVGEQVAERAGVPAGAEGEGAGPRLAEAAPAVGHERLGVAAPLGEGSAGRAECAALAPRAVGAGEHRRRHHRPEPRPDAVLVRPHEVARHEGRVGRGERGAGLLARAGHVPRLLRRRVRGNARRTSPPSERGTRPDETRQNSPRPARADGARGHDLARGGTYGRVPFEHGPRARGARIGLGRGRARGPEAERSP